MSDGIYILNKNSLLHIKNDLLIKEEMCLILMCKYNAYLLDKTCYDLTLIRDICLLDTYIILPFLSSELESKHEFVVKVRDMVKTWPRPIFVVMRYLFAFLNHLSEFRYR